MEVFLDNEEYDINPDDPNNYTLDQFQMDLFGLGPIDNPDLAPIFPSDMKLDSIADNTIALGEYAEKESFEEAVQRDQAAQALLDLRGAQVAAPGSGEKEDERAANALVDMGISRGGGDSDDDEELPPAAPASSSSSSSSAAPSKAPPSGPPAGVGYPGVFLPPRAAKDPGARASALASPRAAGPEPSPAEEAAALERKKARQAAMVKLVIKRKRDQAAAAAAAAANPDDMSIGRAATIVHEFIISDTRLEQLEPNEQATIIHGVPNFKSATTPESCCALCGFQLKDRGSMRMGEVKAIAVSYDHFIPVNFVALVFRIVSRKGQYTKEEFEILKLIGSMVCWHCNYSKGPAMFITCEAGGKGFNNLVPNKFMIRKFFIGLLNSRSKWAFDGKDERETTLEKCIGEGDSEEWLKERVAITMERAAKVAEVMRTKVDFEKTKQRFLLARRTIDNACRMLQENKKWQEKEIEMKTAAVEVPKRMKGRTPNEIQAAVEKFITTCLAARASMKRTFLKKAFAREEVLYPVPWQDELIPPMLDNSDQKFEKVTCFDEPSARLDLKRRKLAGGKRHKTYRMRRCRLPKLL
jgi:hypothetical protein